MARRRAISKRKGSRRYRTMKKRVKYHRGRKRTRLGKMRGGRRRKSRRIKRGGSGVAAAMAAQENLNDLLREFKSENGHQAFQKIILNIARAGEKATLDDTKAELKKETLLIENLRKRIYNKYGSSSRGLALGQSSYKSIINEYAVLVSVAESIYADLKSGHFYDDEQIFKGWMQSNKHLNVIDILQHLDSGFSVDHLNSGHGAGVTAYYLKNHILDEYLKKFEKGNEYEFKNSTDIKTFVEEVFGSGTSKLYRKDGAKALICCGTFFKPTIFDHTAWCEWVNSGNNLNQYDQYDKIHPKFIRYPSNDKPEALEGRMWNIILSIYGKSYIYEYDEVENKVKLVKGLGATSDIVTGYDDGKWKGDNEQNTLKVV